MGFSIVRLKQVLEKVTDYNVLVTILTDGEENTSREYSGHAIKNLIDELKLNRWTFTYIGANHDIEKTAASISITNTMVFHKNETDMKRMFVKEKSSREMYSQKIRDKKDTADDFYNNEEAPNETF